MFFDKARKLQGKFERENPVRESGEIVPNGRSGQIMVLVTSNPIIGGFFGSIHLSKKEEKVSSRSV